VTNTGTRAGAEIAEVYVSLPAAAEDVPKRLVGWRKVWLTAGQSETVRVPIDPKYVSVWDVSSKQWRMPAGSYGVKVGGASDALSLTGSATQP